MVTADANPAQPDPAIALQNQRDDTFLSHGGPHEGNLPTHQPLSMVIEENSGNGLDDISKKDPNSGLHGTAKSQPKDGTAEENIGSPQFIEPSDDGMNGNDDDKSGPKDVIKDKLFGSVDEQAANAAMNDEEHAQNEKTSSTEKKNDAAKKTELQHTAEQILQPGANTVTDNIAQNLIE